MKERLHPDQPWPQLEVSGPPAHDEVRLVRIFLDAPLGPGGDASLSADERERASRFTRAVHRRRFIAGRVGLRHILGHCLGREPSGLRFSYSDRGRPALLLQAGPSLDFNLAHSDELGLLALSRGRLGVDVERLHPLADAMEIARRFFSSREFACLAELPEELRTRGFFNAWTRKEALIKATGMGVAALEAVEVRLSPFEAPAVLAAPGGPDAWRLLHVEPAEGFVGAVAGAGAGDSLELRTWSWPGAVSAAAPS